MLSGEGAEVQHNPHMAEGSSHSVTLQRPGPTIVSPSRVYDRDNINQWFEVTGFTIAGVPNAQTDPTLATRGATEWANYTPCGLAEKVDQLSRNPCSTFGPSSEVTHQEDGADCSNTQRLSPNSSHGPPQPLGLLHLYKEKASNGPTNDTQPDVSAGQTPTPFANQPICPIMQHHISPPFDNQELAQEGHVAPAKTPVEEKGRSAITLGSVCTSYNYTPTSTEITKGALEA